MSVERHLSVFHCVFLWVWHIFRTYLILSFTNLTFATSNLHQANNITFCLLTKRTLFRVRKKLIIGKGLHRLLKNMWTKRKIKQRYAQRSIEKRLAALRKWSLYRKEAQMLDLSVRQIEILIFSPAKWAHRCKKKMLSDLKAEKEIVG